MTESRPTDSLEIKGGAGPFHAAAIVAVIDHVINAEAAAKSRLPPSHLPPAWVRAARPRRPEDPLDLVLPDHRGDPL